MCYYKPNTKTKDMEEKTHTNKEMKTNNKTITIKAIYKKVLQLEAINQDLSFKEFLEGIIEERAKKLIFGGNVAEKPEKKSKAKPLKIPKEALVVPDKIETFEKFTAVNDMTPIGEDFDSPQELDTSGSFSKKVEPGIFTNGKCFELRKFITGEGVQKFHYGSLEEAQNNK